MKGGHLTNVPTYMTYSSVISRDRVCIGFLMDDFNNLDVYPVIFRMLSVKLQLRRIYSSMQVMNGMLIRTKLLLLLERFMVLNNQIYSS